MNTKSQYRDTFKGNHKKSETNKIEKGVEQANFTEIINPDENLIKSNIVTKGNYYLLSKLEAEE